MNNKWLFLNFEQMFAMEKHSRSLAPIEACGLLGGKDQKVKMVLPIKNILDSPVRFSMDPKAQLRAFEQFDSEGLEVVGIYHSHPKGPSFPSPTDIKESEYPVVNIIWSKVGRRWQARGFLINNGKAEEIPLNVVEV